VVVSGFQQVGGLVPVVGSDIAAGADFIQAITPAVASKYFVAIVGSSAPGQGSGSFTSNYGQLYAGQDPPAGAVYAYDATIVLALAVQAAGSTDAAAILTAIPLVSTGPGDAVTSYADGLAALKAGKDINFEGASGPMDFNASHNVFGPFDAVQAGADGKLTTVSTITPAELAAAVQ
jgi:ABC-type branched-subunit amino acid transport system substrate-binding protein